MNLSELKALARSYGYTVRTKKYAEFGVYSIYDNNVKISAGKNSIAEKLGDPEFMAIIDTTRIIDGCFRYVQS